MTAALWPLWAAAYLCTGFAVLALLALRDHWGEVRAAFWLCLLWPLTLVAVALLLVGRVLNALGFGFHGGRPYASRWGAGRVKPQAHLRRRGFWLACPWYAVAVWWARPDWWPA